MNGDTGRVGITGWGGYVPRLRLTAPFAHRQNAAIVVPALNLPETLAASDVGGSQRAGPLRC